MVSLNDVGLEVVKCVHLVVVTCESEFNLCNSWWQVQDMFKFYLLCFMANGSLVAQNFIRHPSPLNCFIWQCSFGFSS